MMKTRKISAVYADTKTGEVFYSDGRRVWPEWSETPPEKPNREYVPGGFKKFIAAHPTVWRS